MFSSEREMFVQLLLSSPLLHLITAAKCIKHQFEVKEHFAKLDLMKPCCVDNDCQSFLPVSEQVNLF